MRSRCPSLHLYFHVTRILFSTLQRAFKRYVEELMNLLQRTMLSLSFKQAQRASMLSLLLAQRASEKYEYVEEYVDTLLSTAKKINLAS